MRHAIVPRLTTSAVLAVAALAACKTEQKPQPAAPPAPPPPHALTIRAKDFAFTMPDTVPAGVTTITLVNDGPDVHHAEFIRLDSGHTAADFAAGMKAMMASKNPPPPPAWVVMSGGPNPPMPGAQTTATIDLAPGNYVVVCFVDSPDHVPHVAKGMAHALAVVANTGAAPAFPTSDIAITTTEYGFAFSDTVRAGHHTFEVKQAGAQPHEVVLVRLAPGKTPADLGKWAATYKGPMPGAIMGGVSPLMPGMRSQFSADITPGNYVMLCFVPDTKDGKLHVEHGMVMPFTVS